MSDYSPPVWKSQGNLGTLLAAAATNRSSSLQAMNQGIQGIADAFKDYDKSKGEERLGLMQSAMMGAPDQASLQEFFSKASKASPGNTDALYKTLAIAQDRIKQDRLRGVMSGDIDPTRADLGSAGNEYQRNTIANRIAGNRLSGYAYPERGNTLVDQQANISALRNSDIYQQANPLVQTAMERGYTTRQNVDPSFLGSPEMAQDKLSSTARARSKESRAATRFAERNNTGVGSGTGSKMKSLTPSQELTYMPKLKKAFADQARNNPGVTFGQFLANNYPANVARRVANDFGVDVLNTFEPVRKKVDTKFWQPSEYEYETPEAAAGHPGLTAEAMANMPDKELRQLLMSQPVQGGTMEDYIPEESAEESAPANDDGMKDRVITLQQHIKEYPGDAEEFKKRFPKLWKQAYGDK